LIPPLVFIGIAEKSNLISELGEWVLRRAFQDSGRWPQWVTSINLSPAQLRNIKFADHVIDLAQTMHVNPRMIELEVTETVLIEDMKAASSQIAKLKQAGFSIALDDFGSGYASLAYLSQIQFDKLKIDRSFVEDIASKAGGSAVVRSIIGLAQAMGLSTTAEGVEDVNQQKVLQAAGCTQMQGFFFHHPSPAEAIEALASDQPVLARHAGGGGNRR
jgi:EAL domain-containing protein (putative c-di-GMP-specific phosphodiesterase class I)